MTLLRLSEEAGPSPDDPERRIAVLWMQRHDLRKGGPDVRLDTQSVRSGGRLHCRRGPSTRPPPRRGGGLPSSPHRGRPPWPTSRRGLPRLWPRLRLPPRARRRPIGFRPPPRNGRGRVLHLLFMGGVSRRPCRDQPHRARVGQVAASYRRKPGEGNLRLPDPPSVGSSTLRRSALPEIGSWPVVRCAAVPRRVRRGRVGLRRRARRLSPGGGGQLPVPGRP